MSNSILGWPKIKTILALVREVNRGAVPGSFAEVGVYKGGVLAELASGSPSREVYGFDTFEGLPAENWSLGEVCPIGMFGDAPYEDVYEVTRGFPNVRLVRGVFPQTATGAPFAFVHLDIDLYLGTLNALRYLCDHMSPGGVIVLDDWGWPQCPGVRRAVEELGLKAIPTTVYQAAIRF